MTRTHRHRIFLCMIVIALASGIFQVTADLRAAEEWQTVTVFSMIPTDEGAPQIRQAVAAMNQPGLLAEVDELEKTQREAFTTLDFSKPKGIVCQTNGRTFRFLAFAAMEDVTALPYGIGEMIADCEVTRDGWYKMPLPGAEQLPLMYRNLFVRQQGDWAYACYGVAQAPKELPDDASLLLEGLPQESPVALRFNCAAMPRSLTNGYVALAKTFLPMAKAFIQMNPMNDSENQVALAAFDFFVVFATETLDQLVKFVNETETITFGLSGNADNDLIMTCQLVAKPGTDTAKDYALMADCTTDLIGLYRPDEAIYAQLSVTPIQAYDQVYLKTILTAAETWIEKIFTISRLNAERFGDNEVVATDKIMALAKKVTDVLHQTIDAGKIDFAESINADYTSLMAMKIAGGNALVRPINELYNYAHLMMAEQLADHGIEEEITLERETYKDFQFWKISFPIAMTGPLTYIIGVSDDMFIYSYGLTLTIMDTLKEAIDRSGTPVSAPKEIIVFAPHRIGQLITTFGFDAIFLEEARDDIMMAMDIINNIPENANIVVAQEVEGNALTWTTVCDGKLWPTVGRILKVSGIAQ